MFSQKVLAWSTMTGVVITSPQGHKLPVTTVLSNRWQLSFLTKRFLKIAFDEIGSTWISCFMHCIYQLKQKKKAITSFHRFMIFPQDLQKQMERKSCSTKCTHFEGMTNKNKPLLAHMDSFVTLLARLCMCMHTRVNLRWPPLHKFCSIDSCLLHSSSVE